MAVCHAHSAPFLAPPASLAAGAVYPTPEQGWFCFGCRRGGTICDLAAEVWGIDTYGAAFLRLRRRLCQTFRRGWAGAES